MSSPLLQCACCDYFSLTDGDWEICPVCFWEDDSVQFRNPEYEGGANKVSLKDARQNFLDYGVSELCFKSDVRPPRPEEHP